MHGMAKMAQISCQKCPLWSVEILAKMVFFTKMAKNHREASDFGKNGLFCINGEFGTNGANHQAPWRVLILAKMEKFSQRAGYSNWLAKVAPWRVAILATLGWRFSRKWQNLAKMANLAQIAKNCQRAGDIQE